MMRSFLTHPTCIVIVCILLSIPAQVYCQFQTNEVPSTYDLPMKRMLVLSTGHYINGIAQGQLDMDSSILFACRIYRLSRLLPYNEGFIQEENSPGSTLIDAGKIGDAVKLLGEVGGEEQLQLLTELGNYYLHKPGNEKTDLDSALFFVQKVNALSGSFSLKKWNTESLMMLGLIHFQSQRIQEGQKYFTEAISTARENGDEVTLAKALHLHGAHLPFADTSKLAILEESRALYKKNKLRIREILVHNEIVSQHFRTNPNRAELEVLEGLKLLEDIGYQHLQYIHNVLAFIYLHRGDHVNARHHAEQSLKHMEITGDVALSSLYYQRMAEVYAYVKRFEEAARWNELGLNVPKSNETRIFWYKNFFERASILGVLNRQAEALKLIDQTASQFPPTNTFDKMYLAYLKGSAHDALNQPNEAEKQYIQFTLMAENFPPEYIHIEMPAAYINISHFYFKQRDYTKSRVYAQLSLDLAKRRGSVANLSSSYFGLFKLDSATGNYLGAVENYKQYKFFNDSAFSLAQLNKLTELEVQYESEKKDQNIKLLTKQSEQADLVRNITFGGVGLLLIILGLLYYSYRAKQHSNDQLQAQQKLISEKNKKLENLLDEKEWLVKEIHHRVKNNLHTIVSLLESQSAYLGNDALAAVRDSQHRVYAMSLIHQKLYLSDNVTTIDMSVYVQELVTYLCDSFNTGQRIRFHVQVEPVSLDVATAIPLGLILNEAITNSIKYAFPESIGVIDISLVESNAQLVLTIADNGVGLPADFDKLKNSLGMRLMKGLSKEIEATFSIENKGGTSISITFRDKSAFRPIWKVGSDKNMEAFA